MGEVAEGGSWWCRWCRWRLDAGSRRMMLVRGGRYDSELDQPQGREQATAASLEAGETPTMDGGQAASLKSAWDEAAEAERRSARREGVWE